MNSQAMDVVAPLPLLSHLELKGFAGPLAPAPLPPSLTHLTLRTDDPAPLTQGT